MATETPTIRVSSCKGSTLEVGGRSGLIIGPSGTDYTVTNEIAAAVNISSSDFRWYAAFHDEGGHPHIHMMSWSAKPGQAYLSKDGIRKIKSALTNDIFKRKMLHTYEQKSASRDELVRRTREEMKSLVQEMQTSIGSYPEVESLMATLAAQLETVKGKKKIWLPSQSGKENRRRDRRSDGAAARH